MRDIALDDPAAYAKAAIDLFDTGSAVIGTFLIKPTKDLRNYKLPATVIRELRISGLSTDPSSKVS